MKISIITINYNNVRGLEQTINSVINQSYNTIDYIIIDGGSVDSSLEVIKSYSKHIAYWTSEKDDGIYDAMNKGIEKANGDYLMFLNSGDYLLNNHIIEISLDQLSRDKTIDILYGDMLISNNITDKYNSKYFKEIKHPTLLDLYYLKNNNINHQASLIKSSIFKEIGKYPSQYKIAADSWLYINCFFKNYKFKKIDLLMIYYDFTGISAIKRNNYNEEMDRIWNDLVPKEVSNLMRNHEILQRKTNRRLNRIANYFIDFYYKIR